MISELLHGLRYPTSTGEAEKARVLYEKKKERKKKVVLLVESPFFVKRVILHSPVNVTMLFITNCLESWPCQRKRDQGGRLG